MAASDALLDEIKQKATAYHEEAKKIRHFIHAHPELSFHEKETASFISQKLLQYGIAHQCNVGGYGIVGFIKGEMPGNKVIALRADMDALPIQEQNETVYKSTNAGVMHACGHDVHSTSLLITAKILMEMRQHFGGTIKLIFQPAEEKLPGGASIMIKEGVLENPAPELIIGQHVFPNMEVGLAGFRSGQYMASADEIYISVKGKGGHAAIPKEYRNPLMAAAALLVEFGKLTEELKQLDSPTVLAFGKIIGNGATNVIPGEVKIDGTLRCTSEEVRKNLWKKISDISSVVQQMHDGITIETKIDEGYPSLFNHPVVTTKAKHAAQKYLGEQQVEELDLRMAAEDFAFYSQKIPATFYRIGTGNKSKGITSPVHTPMFDIDEDALQISTGLMAWIALDAITHN